MLCFLYVLLVVFSFIGLFGFLSFIKILKIWQKPICTPYLLVCLVAVVFIGVYASFLGNIGDIFDISGENDRRGALGALGDYFGGMLNPILAFLSFMVLVAALVYQSKQLEQNEKALEATCNAIRQNEAALAQNAQALKINNQELANSTEQLSLATEAHKEIEKTQKLQQFENNFYQLFNQLNDLQDKTLSESKEAIEEILKHTDSLDAARKSILDNRFISRYFMLLYQLLKLIHSAMAISSSNDKFIERKKFYTNLIRSQQDVRMLKLLFINCYEKFPEYKSYLEDANFFEHMPFGDKNNYSFKLLACLRFYLPDDMDIFLKQESKYFDKSEYYKDIRESYLMLRLYSYPEAYLEKLDKYKFIFELLSEFDWGGRESIEVENNLIINKFIFNNFSKCTIDLDFHKITELRPYKGIFQISRVCDWSILEIHKYGFKIKISDERKIKLCEVSYDFSNNYLIWFFDSDGGLYEHKFALIR